MYEIRLTLLSLFATARAKMNFVTIMTNIQSASDYYPVVKIALADLQQQYPTLLANHTWTHINGSEKFNLCSPDDYFETYSAVSRLYSEGKLREDGALTVTFIPSKKPIAV